MQNFGIFCLIVAKIPVFQYDWHILTWCLHKARKTLTLSENLAPPLLKEVVLFLIICDIFRFPFTIPQKADFAEKRDLLVSSG